MPNLLGDCPMFRRFDIQKVLCSEGSKFRRSYIQKVLCSEGPMFRKKCSKGPIFRRFYVQKVLCSDIFRWSYIQKIHCFMKKKLTSFSFRYKITMQDNKTQPLILAHSVKGQMSFCQGALSVVCPSTICQNRYWDFNQHSEQPQTRSDHRRIVPAIQEYDLVISACLKFREFLILVLFTLVVLL